MRIAAVFVFVVGQVFFITAEQVKRSGQHIEGKIAAGLEKCFAVVEFKAFDALRHNGIFK